jgi:hypothetical protein
MFITPPQKEFATSGDLVVGEHSLAGWLESFVYLKVSRFIWLAN